MSEDKRVLALKYRPKNFEDLIGQDTISQTLALALDNNRLSHAYLFSGLRGSGKTSTARIMAKALLCEHGPTSKPCGVCVHCQSASQNRHLDIVEMDAASNRGIDDIKELIEHTKYKPSSAKYKVFIIDEVHMLTTQAFNALLKTLEEPPSFVKFILATTDPLKLPATILSRTQHFRFKKIPQKLIVNHLEYILNKEQVTFERGALDILARSGSGSLRDTLTLLDQAIIFSKHHITIASVTQMLGLIDPLVMDELFKQLAQGCPVAPLVELFSDYEAGSLIDEISIYLKNKLLDNNLQFSMVVYERFFRVLGESKQLLAINSDNEFVLALMFMKLIESLKLKSIDDLIHDFGKNTPLNTPIPAKTNINTLSQNDAVQVASKPESPSKSPFVVLIEKLYERSAQVGECFENNIEFVSFDEGVLKWISYAQDEDKTLLHKSFPLIKQFIYEIFGENTVIDFQKGEKKNDDLNHQKILDEPQIAQVDETEEDGVGSCIQNIVLNEKEKSAELQIQDILNSKMMDTIKEVFRPSTIIVKARS